MCSSIEFVVGSRMGSREPCSIVPCSIVHERFFESQSSNGLLGHRSRAVAPQQLRPGGKGIVFMRTTPLDLSDLQENFTRMYQEETLDEAEEDVAEEVNSTS